MAMFAKYWQSGKVKTRLARSIGEDAARDVHFLFVRTLLQKFSSFGNCRTLVGSPAEKRSEFESILPESWALQFQSDGDLGQRMSHFFLDNEKDGQLNILIGSDTPDVPQSCMERCVELLNENQLVIGPSRDGGYYLVAMQQHLPQVFEDVPWSSTDVLARTLEIAKQHSLTVGLLPEMNDVDELEDLQQLMANLLADKTDPFATKLATALTEMELKIG